MADPIPDAARAAWRWLEGPGGPPRYALSRTVFLRCFGFIYVIAFGSLLGQLLPLLGHDGLLPIDIAMRRGHAALGASGLYEAPTLFWLLGSSDTVLWWTCLLGLALAVVVMLGRANAVIMAALWALYLSFVTVGQQWFAFGWESQLCEMGFLAIFLAPPWSLRPIPAGDPPPAPVFWLYRWLLFRIMLGAGLIKLRGDPCWVHLTCLDTFYETQPVPNPIAWYLDHAPHGFLAAGVLVNHFVEIVAPFMVFGPRRVRHTGGAIQIAFQAMLVVGGNLSFLNWMTAVNALACFDDTLWERVLPKRMVRRAMSVRGDGKWGALSLPRRVFGGGLLAVIGALSIPVVVNLISPEQVMNTSFEPFRLVNSYGAFGSVGKQRLEIVIEGTLDDPDDPHAAWREYPFRCIPGDPDRRPCFLSPWHYRLDWLAWFAGFQDLDQHPWLVHLVYQLLTGNPRIRTLLAPDPFDGEAPRSVRIERYRYAFSAPGSDAWWTRERVGPYLQPLTLQDPRWKTVLERSGWPAEVPNR